MLFATIAAGGGHVATANAMAEAVSTASKGALSVTVSDIMAEHGPRGLDRRHKESWRRLLARPRLVRAGQAVMDAAPAATRVVQDALLNGFARDVTAALHASPPALVVANHGWLATAFTLARRRYGLRSPVVIYATEPFDASALWSTPAAEVVLAPSAAAKSALVRVGVPADRVLVAGYPVADRFLNAPAKELARAELGLDDAFTCLVTLGAEGVVGDEVIAALLDLAATGARLLCVTGRNAELRARLERAVVDAGLTAGPRVDADASTSAGPVRVFGFVPDMEHLVAAADLVVGKAGPASCLETVAVGRPVLATAYAGLNELAVTRFLHSQRLGGYVGGWHGLSAAVAAWRADPARLAAATSAAGRLDFVAMKRGIGRYLSSCALQALAAGADASLLAPRDVLEPGQFGSVSLATLAEARSERPVAGAA